MSNDTDTATIADFLLARIAEDEAVAQAAHDDLGDRADTYDDPDEPYDVARVWRGMGRSAYTEGLHAPVSWYIQDHPPDRVLAECAAKRRMVEMHRDWPVLVETPPEFDAMPDPTDVSRMTMQMSRRIAWTTEQKYREHFGSEPPTGPILRALASVYADHEDFRDEWR